MKKLILVLSCFFFTTASAEMNNKDKTQALDCVGIYMANYFLPSGEKFEYGMKEKSISTVKDIISEIREENSEDEDFEDEDLEEDEEEEFDEDDEK